MNSKLHKQKAISPGPEFRFPPLLKVIALFVRPIPVPPLFDPCLQICNPLKRHVYAVTEVYELYPMPSPRWGVTMLCVAPYNGELVPKRSNWRLAPC